MDKKIINTAMRILLVEDASVMRKMERKTLAAIDLNNIIEAEDGDAAIAELSSGEKIDLIISDWNMPKKDGYELLLWVRANDRFKTVPFLMATGRGEMKEADQAKKAGVSAFISKPFNAAELKAKIEEAFGIKQVSEKEEENKRIPRITESGRVRLKVAHIQITDHLVLGVLKHLISSGELTPKYFELETECMSSWNPVAKALEKGTVDAACVLAPIAMDLFSYEVPIKMILFAHKNGSIFVRNKSGHEDNDHPENFFKGKSFLIPHTLSIHNILAHMFFTGIGLQAGVTGKESVDVALEVAPPIKMPEFLSTNPDTAGYLVAEPIGTKAIAAGIAELQFLSSELWENHPCCVVAMQDEFIENYQDAVYEFTEMLVYAGKFIDQKPGIAAEVAVNFLDPDKSLGLKVPLLKDVLTEPLGIKTVDLYPVIEDLDRIQRYMHYKMGVGNIIDLAKFVDLRFASRACKDKAKARPSILHESDGRALEILRRRLLGDEEQKRKSRLNKEGKYLMFTLNSQQFGIDILKVKEIIKLIPVRTMPHMPEYIKGIINLRGKVFPIIDLRNWFGMEQTEYNKKTVIIVLEIETRDNSLQMGAIVDSVSEVVDIKATDIEDTPAFGVAVNTKYISALVKADDKIKILLNIDEVLNLKDTGSVQGLFDFNKN
ncbi:MAG: chemotaxis protein CheW [Ignavibacteria bacterium]